MIFYYIFKKIRGTSRIKLNKNLKYVIYKYLITFKNKNIKKLLF